MDKAQRENRRWRGNAWNIYLGDCKVLNEYLDKKSNLSPWIVIKYLNALFRGFSQVAFANNVFSGLLIVIAMFVADVYIGAASVVSATVAILTALLLAQPKEHISEGLTTFNGVLVGTVTASLYPLLYGGKMTGSIWIFIIIGAATSVYVAIGLGNMLASFKVPLPAMAIPFNVVICLIFMCLKPDEEPNSGGHEVKMLEGNSSTSAIPGNMTEVDGDTIDWAMVCLGVLKSSGQVWGVDSATSSILIYIALAIYSPVLCLYSGLGAFIGTFCALGITSPPYDLVYAGVWGFNPLLSCSSIGGMFFVLNVHSTIAALLNAVVTTAMQNALSKSMGGLPVFTLPAMISILIFLSVTSPGDHFCRTTNIRFPELHRHEYNKSRKNKKISEDGTEDALKEIRTDRDEEPSN